MNRKEALIQLKNRIEDQGIIRHYYKKIETTGPCYCTVGHLMEVCGASTDALEGADENNGTEYIKMGISTLTEKKKDLFKSVTELFSVAELVDLQQINDESDDNDEEVLEYINTLIQEETENEVEA